VPLSIHILWAPQQQNRHQSLRQMQDGTVPSGQTNELVRPLVHGLKIFCFALCLDGFNDPITIHLFIALDIV
jgi:hypothetical protein